MTKASSSTAGAEPFKDLELITKEGRLVSLTFSVALYTDVLFSSIPEAILGCYAKFLQLCPADQLKFYATENMKQHKPVTKRVLNMLNVWLKPGAPAREYIALELKDGDDFSWAPKFRFYVWGSEPGSSSYATKHANLVHLAFPPQWGVERTAEMLQLVRELCAIFPYQSGHAGFCFLCSQYDKEESQNHAWAKSIRHRGVDIFAHPNDKKAVGHDAIKGADWLTLLCEAFAERLGGEGKIRQGLPEGVEVLKVPQGLLLQAGPQPRVGDQNRRDFLPEYKAVYRVVAPLAEPGFDRGPALLAGAPDDYKENTIAWRRRFADG
jgi:hypothetical protein